MKNWKRWAMSSGITFATAFAIAIVPNIDSLDLQSFENGAFVAILFTALRAGVKAILEAFISWSAHQE
jgi:hypothetical protein